MENWPNPVFILLLLSFAKGAWVEQLSSISAVWRTCFKMTGLQKNSSLKDKDPEQGRKSGHVDEMRDNNVIVKVVSNKPRRLF